MSTPQAIIFGALLAYTPSALFLAIVLYRDWQEQQERNNHRED